MLKFGLGDLVRGTTPTVENTTEVVEQKAQKEGPWIWAAVAPGDFVTSGFAPNPLFDLGEARPFPQECAICHAIFQCEPVVWKEKVVFKSVVCRGCDPERGTRTQKLDAEIKILSQTRKSQVAPSQRVSPGHPDTLKNILPGPLDRTRKESKSRPASHPDKTNFEFLMEKQTFTPHPVTGPQGHAKFGPSSMKHRDPEAGGCSHWENRGGTHPTAEEGTRLHSALERRLNTEEMLNEGFNEEQITIVQMVRGLFDSLLVTLGDDAVCLVERRLNIADLTWGTADEVLLGKRKANVLDAKFGYNEVDDAKENHQGQCYSLGVFHEFANIEEVEVVFAQPRCDMVTRHTYTRADVPWLTEKVRKIIAGSLDEKAPFNPNPNNCRFCKHQTSCPSIVKVAHKVALAAAPSAEMIGEFAIPAALDPEDCTDPVQIGLGLRLAEFFEDWSKRFKEHAREMALGGVEIPGYAMGHRNAPRAVTDVRAAWHVLQDKLTPEEFASAIKTISIPQLEDIFAAKAPKKKGAKSQAKQQLEDLLRDAGCLRDEGTIPYLTRLKTKPTPSLTAAPTQLLN